VFESFEQALACHALGRLPEAEELYQRVLEADERHFGAVHGLGLIRLQQGRFADAAPLFRRAIKIDRNSAEAHHHLAVALTGLGRPEEAIERFEKALALKSDFAEAHDSFGHALQKLGRFEAAIAHHERAIAIKPSYAEAYNNLGNALHRLGRSDRAIPRHEKALAIRPDYAEAYNNLGLALGAVGRYEEALAHYGKALAIRTDYAEAHINIGNLLLMLGRSEEAVSHCEKALAINSNNVEAHNNMGDALRALGRLDEAIQAFERALALAPRKAGNYWNLAGSRRFTAADPHLKAMKKLAQEMASLDVEDQIGLHFALAKAFADLGDPRQSSYQLLRGNSLKRQQISYDEARTLERFDRIRATFAVDLIREREGLGHASSTPLFILGMPRSGTTLVEQILASHPMVYGAGELHEIGEIAKTIRGANRSEFPEAVATLSGEQLRELGQRYLRAMGQVAPAAVRVTDKMPHNFPWTGLIHLILPNARIINTRRDPRDVALSCFSLLFARGQMAFSYDLAELGRYYRAYEALMEHWRNVLPEGVMLEVQYEELVGNLDQQARRIVAHCGLEWDDACLNFYRTERAVRTASVTQVRQPIYNSSVGRWRRYEDLLRPFLQALEGNERSPQLTDPNSTRLPLMSVPSSTGTAQ
jgi:tetratricopeptide (TPR) repeat protein